MLTLVVIVFVLNFILIFINYAIQSYKTALFASFVSGFLLSRIIDTVLKNILT